MTAHTTTTKVQLGGLCVKIGSGITPRGGASVYTESGTALIRSQNVYNSEFHEAGLAFVNDQIAERMKGVTVEAGDVLLNITGDSVARCCLVPDAVLPARVNQHVAIIRPDSSKLDSRYLAHFMVSPFMQTTMLSWAGSGGTRKALTKTMVEGFEIPLPDIAEQRRIAAVLSDYNDLIENNRRRIVLLEEAAWLLYREWFVHFRFPGHEHVKTIDGVPEGWTQSKIGDLTTKLGSGATPRGGAGSYKSSGTTLVRSLNVYDHSFHDDGLAFIDDEQAKKLQNVVVEAMDVLLNITGASVARCCIVPRRHLPARVNQHVMIIRADPEKCRPLFILHSINAHQNKEKLLSIARSGGATREALTKDTIAGFEILLPPESLVESFDDIVFPMFLLCEKLAASVSELTKARDLLLPRLMDGRLEI